MSFTVPSPTDALLSAQNVTMRFGGIVAVNEMNVALPKGSICGIIGPNGAVRYHWSQRCRQDDAVQHPERLLHTHRG